jgi:hypothetical protein
MTTEAYELPALPQELVGYFNADHATRERMGELIREYARAAIQQERERCANLVMSRAPADGVTDATAWFQLAVDIRAG